MVTWLVFGLMVGAVLAAFRAATVLLLARDQVDGTFASAARYVEARSAALRWALFGAACLVALSLGGLWRVAQAVTQ